MVELPFPLIRGALWRRLLFPGEEAPADTATGEGGSEGGGEGGEGGEGGGSSADGRRACPRCPDGRLQIKFSRSVPFVGCSSYPACSYTRPFGRGAGEAGGELIEASRELGRDAETGLEVSLRRGPFGPYVQLGGSAAAAAEKTALPDVAKLKVAQLRSELEARDQRPPRPFLDLSWTFPGPFLDLS